MFLSTSARWPGDHEAAFTTCLVNKQTLLGGAVPSCIWPIPRPRWEDKGEALPQSRQPAGQAADGKIPVNEALASGAGGRGLLGRFALPQKESRLTSLSSHPPVKSAPLTLGRELSVSQTVFPHRFLSAGLIRAFNRLTCFGILEEEDSDLAPPLISCVTHADDKSSLQVPHLSRERRLF